MSDTTPRVPLQSPLGRVRGLGSAKQGSHHWWLQRVNSVAMVPLVLWFIFSVATMGGKSHAEVVAWIGHPLNATLLLLSIGLSFQHAASGMQVVIEDYTRSEMVRMASILAVKAACALFGVLAAVAVLKIAI